MYQNEDNYCLFSLPKIRSISLAFVSILEVKMSQEMSKHCSRFELKSVEICLYLFFHQENICFELKLGSKWSHLSLNFKWPLRFETSVRFISKNCINIIIYPSFLCQKTLFYWIKRVSGNSKSQKKETFFSLRTEWPLV